MKTGRKPHPTPDAPTDALNHTALAQDSAALTVLGQRSTEIAERFGDGTAYDRHRVVSEAKFYMATSAEAMLELGKRLIQIKENEPHGEFVEIVEVRLGMAARAAQKMMQAAAKYLAPALAAKAPSMALLGKSKLFDLMAESDEDLVELAEGGTLAGATLSELATMTRREMQAALTEAKKVADAKDKVIAKKDKKLAEIAEAEERRNSNETTAQLDRMRDATLAIEQALATLLNAIDDVMRDPGGEAAALSARQTLDYVCQHLADAAEARSIAIDLEERVMPLHMKPIREVVEAAAAATQKRRA